MKKQTVRKGLPILPADWLDRSYDDTILDAPGKMALYGGAEKESQSFRIELLIVTGVGTAASFMARATTQREAIRMAETAAMAAGVVERRGKK